MIHAISCTFIFTLIILHPIILLSLSISSLPLVSTVSASTFITKPIISFCTTFSTSCAVFNNKRLKCFGSGTARGSLKSTGASPYTIGSNITYVNLGTGVSVEKVSCGTSHMCMKLSSGNLKCMGFNANGEVGVGVNGFGLIGESNGYIGDNLPFVNLGNGLQVLDVSLAKEQSCVVLTGLRVKCFGYNGYGGLGLGDIEPRGKFLTDMGDNLTFIDFGTNVVISSIHSGTSSSHYCAILSAPANAAQRIKCWGMNYFYQLGYGDQNDRGNQPGEMGDNLNFVDLGTESKVKQVSVEQFHTCALLVNDKLKCFGDADYGRLGSGSVTDIRSTGDSTPFVQIDSGRTVKLLKAGYHHTCIVYDDMISMKCFGRNDYGQLGQADSTDRGDSPTTLVPSIPFIDLGTGALNISSIHCSPRYNCVVFVDDTVRCFGSNEDGQLGIGTDDFAIGDEAGEMGTNLKAAIMFSTTSAPTKAPTRSPSLPTQSPTTSKPTTNSPTSTKSPTKSDGMLNARVTKISMLLCLIASIIGLVV